MAQRGAIRIEGVEDCLRMFEQVPENMLKISRAAMRAASKETAKKIRKGTPKRFRRLTRYKVGKTAAGNVYARIGLYNGKQISGNQPKKGQIPDWFKAYWANYGTLKHRDPSHPFQYKVKPKSRHRRNDVGQRAQNFFEGAIQGWEDVFVEAFSNEIKKQEDELYNR